jgi:uncharacterized protein involved in exopolysaccharide biosynthesis
MRSSAILTARPRYGLMDLVALLVRELWVMIAVFLVVFAIGAAAAFLMPKSYTATASLVVSVGDEYVYRPITGQATPGAAPLVGEVAASEAAILNSDELKRRVVQEVGAATILGAEASDGAVSAETLAIRALGQNLGIGVSPLSGVIDLGYKSKNADRAARILNAVIDQYLVYRREVFRDVTTPALQDQLQSFEGELREADSAYEAFLRSNNIGDFATARTTLSATYQQVFGERLAVDAQLRAAEARLNSLRTQLGAIPAEIALQQQLNISAQDQILVLRTEREQLLARYLPDAQPVRDIDARIAQLQGFVATGTAVGPREVQTGPNPIYVSLETERAQVQAERDSLAARRAVLETQLDDLRNRQARLTDLESRNTTLTGDREVLTGNIREFTLRESQSRAASELARRGADNIRVVERASPPVRGKSLKMPLFVLAFLFAGFTALCVGLARIFLQRGFVTAGSVSRTLQMPILAVAPMKARA